MAGLSVQDQTENWRQTTDSHAPRPNGHDAHPRRAPCVLQIVPDLGAGGAEQTTIDMARAITTAGGRALVASRGGFRENELKRAGGVLLRRPMATKNPYEMLLNIVRLAQVIERARVDLVHVRSRAPAWSALAAARLMGVPLVTTYHGTYNARSGPKRFYNSGMVRGQAVIANSQFIAAHVAGEHGLAPEAIDVIPRGIDLTHFDPARVDPDAVSAQRAAWTGSAARARGTTGGGNRRVLLLPGRLTRWKGQGVFLDALASLRAQSAHRDDWIAVLVGDAQGRDAYAAGLREQAADLGLADRVVFAGHCGDMPTAYLAADIVLSPAIEPEAFGRVPVEAQAMGRPVIAADHGGSRETVLDARDGAGPATGWRVTPGSAEDLAHAMAAALDLDWPGFEAMGRAGRCFATERYSLDAMTAHTLRVYDRVLADWHASRNTA